MILKETLLNVVDNSGAFIVKCIGLPKNSKKKVAYIGDYIMVAIQSQDILKKKIINKVYLALIINIKKNTRRKDGHYFSTDTNNVVLLTERLELLGTFVDAPIPSEVAGKKHNLRLLQLAQSVV